MIEVLQGALGSGKSATAVARAFYHLKRGGVVCANFSLVDGWAQKLADNLLLSKIPFFGPRYAAKKAVSFYKRFFRVDTLDAINKINPRELSVDIYQDNGKYSEGNGLLILDECHLMFNTRDWQRNQNQGWIQFFSQSRKKGWDVLLISHSIESIDKQIRPLCELESRFRNLQKIHFPLIGFPLSPIPLFLVITRYAGLGAGSGVIAYKNLYPLPAYAAALYDSLEVFGDRKDLSNQALPCGNPPDTLCVDGGFPERKYLSATSIDCLWSRWEYVSNHPS